jgi:hypothetical protein
VDSQAHGCPLDVHESSSIKDRLSFQPRTLDETAEFIKIRVDGPFGSPSEDVFEKEGAKGWKLKTQSKATDSDLTYVNFSRDFDRCWNRCHAICLYP